MDITSLRSAIEDARRKTLGDGYTADVREDGAGFTVDVSDGREKIRAGSSGPWWREDAHDLARDVLHRARLHFSRIPQPSRIFRQKPERNDSALLAACAGMCETETQTIDRLAEENRRMRADLMRLAELTSAPVAARIPIPPPSWGTIQVFIDSAVAAERERCTKAAREEADGCEVGGEGHDLAARILRAIEGA